jgi:hypothetical protein
MIACTLVLVMDILKGTMLFFKKLCLAFMSYQYDPIMLYLY